MGAFGEKLRKQREQRGIELDAISNTTKIGTRMLRALEDEHFDQLPGGVFNKGFVRAYARHVGLDEEEAVADYLAALRENQVQAGQIMPNLRGKPADDAAPDLRPGNLRPEVPPRSQPQPMPKFSAAPALADNLPAERFAKKYPAGVLAQSADEPSREIPWAKLAAVLVLIALTVVVWSLRRHGKLSAAVQPVKSPVETSPSDLGTPAAASNPRTESVKVEPAKPEPVKTAETGALAGNVEGSSKPAGLISSASSPSTSAPGPSAPASAPKPSANAASPAGNPSPENLPAAKSPAGNRDKSAAAIEKSAPPFHLQIRASENSWVSIIVDGNPVAHETLIAPASTTVRATHEIVVRVGNAAGLSFLLNGKEIPAQGNEGEVKTYTFDATGLREPPP